MTALQRLRASTRHLAIPGQGLALVLSLLQAMLWLPMWAGALTLIGDLWWAVFQREISAVHWIALWATAIVRLAIWTLKELLDLDMSDNRHGP